eukprot:scaffold264_cov95-Skeletonema_dohrnii-CCMP3373.AAC.1
MNYATDAWFNSAVNKLQEVVADMVSMAGDGGIVTSESISCLVAESLLSDAEYQLLSRITEGSA